MKSIKVFDLNMNDQYVKLNSYISQPLTRITHLEACDNYCFVHYIDRKKNMISKCLKYLHNLDALKCFVRTHRKYAINPYHIKAYHPHKSIIELKSGKMISVSRTQRKKVADYLLAE